MTSAIRLILTDDGATLSGWPTPPTSEVIEEHVRQYADQGVDVLSYCVGSGHTANYDSRVLYCRPLREEDDSLSARNIRHMVENGLDLPQVIAESCHRHGLLFWPNLRMNSSARTPSPAHDEHPDWFYGGHAAQCGFAGIYRPMLNYEVSRNRVKRWDRS